MGSERNSWVWKRIWSRAQNKNKEITKSAPIFFLPYYLWDALSAEHKVDTFPEWCEQITGVDL